jgi:DNA polymerase
MYNTHDLVALDFETYSDVDLKKHGLDNYTKGKHFKLLLAGLAWYRGVILTQLIDFVNAVDVDKAIADLHDHLSDRMIVAHNATFEREVLKAIGINIPIDRFIDSAVLARAAGYGGSLENAARQLMQENKHAEGERLVKQYCVPTKDQQATGDLWFQGYNRHVLQDWLDFGVYCVQDAELSLRLTTQLLQDVPTNEVQYSQATMRMNEAGWPVDLELVDLMNRQYKSNLDHLVQDFRTATGAGDLNLNSTQQLTKWCAERGVTAKSFDEKAVARMLKQVTKRLDVTPTTDPKHDKLWDVQQLLITKQQLGGSSLKKLDVILNTTGPDGRLRNQYMHLGASATFRTSGRGVQMQNLKRLHGEGDDVNELLMQGETWSNDQLASNLRQCFRSSDPLGSLIVGDFSSVESRGLAWQAGEQWKTDAYFNGDDLYKVQAASMFGIPIAAIGKSERQIGKVAELSCGYGAGPGAVKDFAEKMGVTLSEAESTKLVRDWRDANQQIVQYWKNLDHALHQALEQGVGRVDTGTVNIEILKNFAPTSLTQQVGQQMYSLRIEMTHRGDDIVNRVIHGVYEDGNNLGYYKPSERKTGDPWLKDYVDPKTKRRRTYNIYGGKLSGILTQSLCREIFFRSLMAADAAFENIDNVQLIGQFHDELVLDWTQRRTAFDESLAEAKGRLQHCMTTTSLSGFPLGADIKSAYRYIK